MPIDSIAQLVDMQPTAPLIADNTTTPAPYEFRLVATSGQNGDNHVPRGADEADIRERMQAACRDAFEQGRRDGQRTGREEAQLSSAAAISVERERVAAAIRDFIEERDRYFAEVEQEVVKLSLAIGARVLHREVQLDPLLLSGAVRVALGKLADSSGVTLRVPVEQIAAWEKTVKLMDGADRPTVAGDPSLTAGDAVIETRMGTVELGIAAQLEEIERGFFDLLNRRPVS